MNRGTKDFLVGLVSVIVCAWLFYVLFLLDDLEERVNAIESIKIDPGKATVALSVQDDHEYSDDWIWDADHKRKVQSYKLNNVTDWQIMKFSDEEYYKVWGMVGSSGFIPFKSTNKDECVAYIDAMAVSNK